MRFSFAGSLLLTLLGVSALAQVGPRYSLLLYNYSSIERVTFTIFDSTAVRSVAINTEVRYLSLTAAFRLRSRRGNLHEFELSRLDGARRRPAAISLPNGQPLQVTTEFDIALRYEYILDFMQEDETRFHFMLGFSPSPYFLSSTFDDNRTLVSEQRLGVRASLVPRFTYEFASRFYTDLNFVLPSFKLEYSTRSVQHASVPGQIPRSTTFDFQQFPLFFGARLGVGIRL